MYCNSSKIFVEICCYFSKSVKALENNNFWCSAGAAYVEELKAFWKVKPVFWGQMMPWKSVFERETLISVLALHVRLHDFKWSSQKERQLLPWTKWANDQINSWLYKSDLILPQAVCLLAPSPNWPTVLYLFQDIWKKYIFQVYVICFYNFIL